MTLNRKSADITSTAYKQFYWGGIFCRNNALNLLEWRKAWLPN